MSGPASSSSNRNVPKKRGRGRPPATARIGYLAVVNPNENVVASDSKSINDGEECSGDHQGPPSSNRTTTAVVDNNNHDHKNNPSMSVNVANEQPAVNVQVGGIRVIVDKPDPIPNANNFIGQQEWIPTLRMTWYFNQQPQQQ